MGLDLEDLMRNEQAKIRLVLEQKGERGGGKGAKYGATGADIDVLDCYMQKGFSLEGTANYDGIGEKVAEGIKSVGAALLGEAGMKAVETAASLAKTSGTKVVHPSANVKVWQNSSVPDFSIDVKFIALEPGHDVRLDTLKIYKYIWPSVKGSGPLGVKLLNAPGGYGLEPFKKKGGEVGLIATGGTVTMFWGRHVRIPNLIITSASFEFTPEVNSRGFPLWADGNIKLELYRGMTFDGDVENWFVKKPPIPGTTGW